MGKIVSFRRQSPASGVLDVMTIEQQINFGILCAVAVCDNQDFVEWANGWLSGQDRSDKAALAAKNAATERVNAAHAADAQADYFAPPSARFHSAQATYYAAAIAAYHAYVPENDPFYQEYKRAIDALERKRAADPIRRQQEEEFTYKTAAEDAFNHASSANPNLDLNSLAEKARGQKS